MKNRLLFVLLVAVFVAAILAPAPPRHVAIADRTAVALMSGQSSAGTTLADFGSTGTEDPASWYIFQFVGSGPLARATIESTLDGTNWRTEYAFKSTSDVYRAPVCGSCRFRVRALYADASNTVTVIAAISGAGAATAPTYTATATSTATPTQTPTYTPTATVTTTPTPG
jgi:hypothetical protein